MGVDQAPTSISEVTLDKSNEAERAAANAAPDAVDLDQMAAELEQTKSLEDMSDQLAETLFGCEELEAISLQIREEGVPEEESPVALEPPAAADAAATPTPEVAIASAEPAPAPLPATPPKPAADVGVAAESAAAAAPPPENQRMEPEPIDNQFKTTITATLRTLDIDSNTPDDYESEKSPGSLLSRLKDTFKS